MGRNGERRGRWEMESKRKLRSEKMGERLENAKEKGREKLERGKIFRVNIFRVKVEAR